MERSLCSSLQIFEQWYKSPFYEEEDAIVYHQIYFVRAELDYVQKLLILASQYIYFVSIFDVVFLERTTHWDKSPHLCSVSGGDVCEVVGALG